MKKSIKSAIREEEVAGEAVLPEKDEMSEIQKFIQKRRLQNKILKKLTDELQSVSPAELNKSKSA